MRRVRFARILRIGLLVLAMLGLLVLSTSCSPWYVLRAGWEEAGILLGREDIAELLEDPATDPKLKETFRHVLAAREASIGLGLKPEGSFTQYSEIDRDVLIWVLSACPKTSLTPKTWWFPIVGNVPYKGFFEKEDGIAEAKGLQAQGYDIYLRPAAAFSTLGWFNDPLMSTMKHYDSVALVNTVIHEILHNTVWIPNHATFNESLANVVGAVGAIEYFRTHTGPESEFTKLAENRWHDEQVYADFLSKLLERLERFYAQIPQQVPAGSSSKELAAQDVPEEVLAAREEIFAEARTRWAELGPTLKNAEYRDINKALNNAVLFGQRIYLDRIWLFTDALAVCDSSIPCLVKQIDAVKTELAEGKASDPFTALLNRIETLKAQKLAQSEVPMTGDEANKR